MDVAVIFLLVVCLFLLPTIPAVLFYKLSPKAVAKEARTVAAYGPISVKIGGSAALFLAFFFLLHQTPLMNVLEDAIHDKLTGQISLTGNIEFPLPEDVTDDQDTIQPFSQPCQVSDLGRIERQEMIQAPHGLGDVCVEWCFLHEANVREQGMISKIS